MRIIVHIVVVDKYVDYVERGKKESERAYVCYHPKRALNRHINTHKPKITYKVVYYYKRLPACAC